MLSSPRPGGYPPPPTAPRKIALTAHRPRRHHGPRLDVVAIINQGVLYQQVGGPAVAAEQLAHLLELAERDNVTIRVLPYGAGAHPAMHGPFTRLEFPIDRDPGVVYLEALSGGRYRDDTEDIDRYTRAGDRLVELALPEPDSLSLIDTIRKELAP